MSMKQMIGRSGCANQAPIAAAREKPIAVLPLLVLAGWAVYLAAPIALVAPAGFAGMPAMAGVVASTRAVKAMRLPSGLQARLRGAMLPLVMGVPTPCSTSITQICGLPANGAT